MHKQRTRIAAAGLALLLACSPATGGLSNFYDSVSSYYNVTSPQAIEGQAMHVFTGGGLYYRSPMKTYSLFNMSLPSLRAGCGGIDFFGGSFSFINADEFVQLLRNIGQNAVGVFFMTAMQAMAPDIAEIIKYLQNVAQDMNATNVNSCEAAEWLVNASKAYILNKSNAQTSLITAMKNSLFSDYDQARREVAGDDAKAQQTQDAVKNDPNANARLVMGNIVWRAMSRAGLASYLSEKERRLAMSTVGALVFSPAPGAPEGSPPRLSYKPRTITFEQLINKGDGAENAASNPKIITCLDGTGEEQCTVMGNEPYDGEPFAKLAAQKMREIYDKIRTRSALSHGEIGFVNATSIPVYRLLSVAAAYEPDSVAHSMIETYSDAIGAELAAAFILKALDEVEKALFSRAYEGAQAEVDALKEFRATMNALRQEIHKQRIAYTNKINSLGAMMEKVTFLEKSYMNTLSDRVAASLRFSRRVRGQS